MIGNVYMCSVGDDRAYVVASERYLARCAMADECKVHFTKVRCKQVKKNVKTDLDGVIMEADAYYNLGLPPLGSYEED